VSPAAPAREPVLRGDETTERFAAATAALRLDDTQRDAVTAVLGQPRAGLYLHGPVGRGKSMLAELYLATFDPDTSLRLHLNELFRRLQAELIREWKAPAIVLRRLLGPVRALLVDEFHVHDVADAVYLSALLEVVAEDRIVLIATSNYAPHDLMPDPKLHERFLPAIERITAELGVIAVGSGPDHRALGDDGRATFVSGRWTITPGIPASALQIDGIPLHPLEMADGRIAFDFAGICDAAVGVRQYQGIADRFETVEVRGVPDLAVVRREPLMRFATLVDVLYDHDVRLVVTSAAPFERLTDAEAPPVDSDRVISRLRALRG
uniref:cell division protein ZapE n=1 Tax=Microbacterium sp. Ld14 TaxID=649156 RepID=UPI00386C1B07